MSALAAYEEALLYGTDCWVRERGAAPVSLPVRSWLGEARPDDEDVLAACEAGGGAVLDIGCGPGRLTVELRARGVRTLGIDVSAAAVELARRRGAWVLRRDVFGAVPGVGRWRCALLADGNIGIGGDPVALLRRCAGLLHPAGVVVAELAAARIGVRRGVVHIEAAARSGTVGGPLPWASVGADAAVELGSAAGLRLRSVRPTRDGEWALAVWDKESSGV